MKKLLIAIILITSSCSQNIPDKGYKITSKAGYSFYVVDIDSCEYIRSDVYGGYNLTHKGNCKNPIHNK
jgi:hypothetical protein